MKIHKIETDLATDYRTGIVVRVLEWWSEHWQDVSVSGVTIKWDMKRGKWIATIRYVDVKI